MPYFVEDTKDVTIYKVVGFFSFQDMEGLTEAFDSLVEANSQARILMDFSSQTGYEEATIKSAFRRIDKGLPSGILIAIVFEGKGTVYNHILGLIAKAMPQNAKFFDGRIKALKWLQG